MTSYASPTLLKIFYNKFVKKTHIFFLLWTSSDLDCKKTRIFYQKSQFCRQKNIYVAFSNFRVNILKVVFEIANEFFF